MARVVARAMTTPPPIPVPKTDWFARNWKWFIPGVALFAVAFFAGSALLLFSSITSVIRDSDPYTHAMSRVHTSAAVAEALGTPVTEGWFISGSITTNINGTGNAVLRIPISGPKGAATVHVLARRVRGVWEYRTLLVEITATHQRINLADTLRAPPAR